MSEHRNLTGASLHDVKGAATSTTGQILVSTGGASTFGDLTDASTDGAAAGSLLVADGLGGSSFERYQGWAQFQDSRTTDTPAALNLATGVRTKLPIDGGTSTIQRNPSDAIVPMWDVINNKHVPIAEMDVYHLRIGFIAENYAGTEPYVSLELDIGGSIGTIVARDISLRKSGSAVICSASFPVFSGSTYLANGGELYVTYTGTGTCDIHTTSIMIVRESKDYT